VQVSEFDRETNQSGSVFLYFVCIRVYEHTAEDSEGEKRQKRSELH